MPRPRKASDEEIFAATYRAMTRLGPGELTLAEIAAEAGVTAGAIVQRFGSKRALLLAISEGVAAASGDLIRGLRAASVSPLAAIRAYADCMAGLASSPDAVARNLAYLQNDLADPDFRRNLLAQSRATREGLTDLVAAAVAAGELSPETDAPRLARSVETMIGGSLFTWATYREGSALEWLRADLEAVLAPHLARREPEGRRSVVRDLSRAPGA